MDEEITTATERIFRKLYITAPLNYGQSLDNLQSVGAMCSELTIGIGQSEPAPTQEGRPRSWRRRLSGVTRAAEREGHVSSPMWTAVRNALRRRSSMMSLDSDATMLSEPSASSYPPSTLLSSAAASLDGSPSSVTSTTENEPVSAATSLAQRALQNKADEEAITYWCAVFASFKKINTLTFVVKGDTAWPGSTDIEYVLIILRTALELTHLPYLQRVRFQPLHAMGLVVMRWHGFGAVTRAPAAAYEVWQNISSLDLQIHNPFDRLSHSQKVFFSEALHDYLSSFSSTVKRLRFIWLDHAGPSPMALEQEVAIKDARQAIHWEKLEDLWLGNTTMLDYTLRTAIGQHAPHVRTLKTLRPDLGQTTAVFELHSSWIDVVLPPRAATEERQSQVGWWDMLSVEGDDDQRDSYVTNTSTYSQMP